MHRENDKKKDMVREVDSTPEKWDPAFSLPPTAFSSVSRGDEGTVGPTSFSAPDVEFQSFSRQTGCLIPASIPSHPGPEHNPASWSTLSPDKDYLKQLVKEPTSLR